MCVGPLKSLCHWGPLTALGIIKCVSYMTVHCNNMWWPPTASFGGFVNSGSFLLFSGLTLFNFLSAIYEGPGYLPLNWKPEVLEDTQYLQFCKVCQGYKAPRAHHCRKCGRCVLKMDHHCPWINNCVGHMNHGYFTGFLFWAVCGCFQASIVLTCSLYRALNRTWYVYYGSGSEPIVTLTVYTLVLCVFSLGLAIGVVLAVGMLLYFQLRSILRNQTGIEDWIVEKARHRLYEEEDPPFVYPYNLGRRENFKQVITWSLGAVGDGINWPVHEGCHPYALTVEQQRQKCEKRQRTRTYTAVKRYSGYWFPLVHGWRVLLHPPFTDEPRIPLLHGDVVMVTRWRRYWLFGEKAQQAPDSVRVRGWFPRSCVVELTEGGPPHNLDPKNK